MKPLDLRPHGVFRDIQLDSQFPDRPAAPAQQQKHPASRRLEEACPIFVACRHAFILPPE
ncbi:MAG TPA: hypothetical protein VH518_10285 [Tepidisphaeraceae bacterium]